MSCSPFDLKEYFLRELNPADSGRVEAHLKSCAGCREEMDRLRLTEAALSSLREEEIPQRIAFVSDQVFEPSPLRRWWGAFWDSSARLGFAAAAMLSGAILISAFTRPAPVMNLPAPAHSTQVSMQSSAQTFSGAEIDRRIQQVVAVEAAKAVARAEAAHLAEVRELRDDLNKARYSLTVAASEYDVEARRHGVLAVAANGYTFPKSDPAGESK
ncbi:MAG: anti-sigma factor family protein [Bryobacteraceae bacterium]